jgi:hypothetical protein
MFETELKQKLKRIFDLKVTFDEPPVKLDRSIPSREQECIFVRIDSAKSRIFDRRQTAKVMGKLIVFCNSDKLPYGYFSKKIAAANKSDLSSLFFYDIEENAGIFLNISERSMSFVFLFDSQYDPNIGTLNTVDLSEAFT